MRRSRISGDGKGNGDAVSPAASGRCRFATVRRERFEVRRAQRKGRRMGRLHRRGGGHGLDGVGKHTYGNSAGPGIEQGANHVAAAWQLGGSLVDGLAPVVEGNHPCREGRARAVGRCGSRAGSLVGGAAAALPMSAPARPSTHTRFGKYPGEGQTDRARYRAYDVGRHATASVRTRVRPAAQSCHGSDCRLPDANSRSRPPALPCPDSDANAAGHNGNSCRQRNNNRRKNIGKGTWRGERMPRPRDAFPQRTVVCRSWERLVAVPRATASVGLSPRSGVATWRTKSTWFKTSVGTHNR